MNVLEKGAWQGIPNGRMVKELLVFFEKDLEAVHYAEYKAVVLGVSFAADAVLHRVLFAQDTCVLTETEVDAENGKYYAIAVDMDNGGVSADLREWLFLNKNTPMGAIVRDGNNVLWFIQLGLYTSMNKVIGPKNTLGIRLSVDSPLPVSEMREMSLESIQEEAEFSSEFNEDFNN